MSSQREPRRSTRINKSGGTPGESGELLPVSLVLLTEQRCSPELTTGFVCISLLLTKQLFPSLETSQKVLQFVAVVFASSASSSSRSLSCFVAVAKVSE